MTWETFVAKVDAELAAKGLARTTPLAWIAWNRDAHGGTEPGVYVNALTHPSKDLRVNEVVVLGIGED